ncbi:cell division protein SepF [Micromonospora sp. WMMD734]|uniref:cell division protein SepF n=1 Tax=Micromonospora sp. WMMD734 TaxID=3404129 RepID=UPI003B9552D3
MTVEEVLLTGGSALLVFLGSVLVRLMGKEVESLLGAFPVLLLRLARRRVPHGIRDDLYEEWLAELAEALHGKSERPLTRLWLGLRFSSGLLRSAGEVGRALNLIRNRSDEAASEAAPVPVPAAGDLSEIDEHLAQGVWNATLITPTTYRAAREIGQAFRDGNRVVIDLTKIEEYQARRLVDFSAGLCFAQRGTIERVTNRVFLLAPPPDQPEQPLLSA